VTDVKVCGITRVEDAELAAELGAWAVGLIFHRPSPRACKLAAAEAIGAALKRRCEVAGVFVNAPLEDVAYAADRCGLTILQLHGDEGPSYCTEAARRTGAKVMKAVRVHDAGAVRAIDRFRTDLHLLDAYVPGVRGGTGESFDWDLARLHERRVPLVLSGGLGPDNVAEAIRVVRPDAVDSASRTEARPGVKDPAKVHALFRAVEQVDAALAA
jgi:phosphoribosylanthranilate isomerase